MMTATDQPRRRFATCAADAPSAMDVSAESTQVDVLASFYAKYDADKVALTLPITPLLY